MHDGIFLYPLLTAALFYLGARATITYPIWSRFPGWLSEMTQCPSCGGFWYGAGVGLIGWRLNIPFLGITAWWSIGAVMLAAVTWTPIVAALHEFSIRAVTNNRLPVTIVIQRPDVDDKPAE